MKIQNYIIIAKGQRFTTVFMVVNLFILKKWIK